MAAIIDVDEVLIDTPRLKERLGNRARTVANLEAIHEEDPAFLPSLFFADAKDFLQNNLGSYVLVTSAKSRDDDLNIDEGTERAFQMRKLELCGITALMSESDRERYIEVAYGEKTDSYKKAQETLGVSVEAVVVIDDNPEHLRAAERLGMKPQLMRRKECTRQGGFESMHTLTQSFIESFVDLQDSTEEVMRAA